MSTEIYCHECGAPARSVVVSVPKRTVDVVEAAVAPLRAELDAARADRDEYRKAFERSAGDRAALDVAVRGLRELETTWAEDADAADEWSDPAGHVAADIIRESVNAVSALLDKIGGTR